MTATETAAMAILRVLDIGRSCGSDMGYMCRRPTERFKW